jgi:hypothetical protein
MMALNTPINDIDKLIPKNEEEEKEKENQKKMKHKKEIEGLSRDE